MDDGVAESWCGGNFDLSEDFEKRNCWDWCWEMKLWVDLDLSEDDSFGFSLGFISKVLIGWGVGRFLLFVVNFVRLC